MGFSRQEYSMLDPVGQSWGRSTSCSPQQENWAACVHDSMSPSSVQLIPLHRSILGVAEFHQVIKGPSLLTCMALPSSRFLKLSPFSWQILCERFPWVSPGLCSHHLCSDHIDPDVVTWPHLTEGRLEIRRTLYPQNHFTDQSPAPQNCLLKADERWREVPSFWLGLLNRWWCHLMWKTQEAADFRGSRAVS